MSRIIFHVDVNSAFLSWTAVKRLKDDPGSVDLRTIPSVVGGDIKTRHGIVTAKSIPAKKYGIQTAEPITSALQKCPNLVIVPSDFATYREYSHGFIEILRSYSEILEQVSIDEAFLDVTDLRSSYPSDDFPLNISTSIRDEIRNTLGFTVNVGISTNKLLAKMASDFTKPDKTHTLYPDQIREKMWPLDIGDLFGCGKKTAEKLRAVGIRTIGEAAQSDEQLLISILGEKTGEYIHQSANGISSDFVCPVRDDPKSYSNETTTKNDITTDNYISDLPPIVRYLSDKVSQRLKKDSVYGLVVSVQVKTSEFKRYSRQIKLSQSTNDADVIYDNAMSLLSALLTGEKGLFQDNTKIRLVGVGIDHLDKGEYRQENLFDWMTTGKEELRLEKQKKEKEDKLERMEKTLRDKFGEGVIHKGTSQK
jgi:DNA polymerase-4